MTKQQSNIFFDETNGDSMRQAHRFSHEAMATTFEIFIVHSDSRYAAQAAWAAFDELDRLETELNRFIENSDISRINNLTANQPLRIGLPAFECLQLSSRIYDETEGAFDITIGSLLECWLGKGDKAGRCPSKEQLNVVRQHTGLHLIELDEAQHTVNLRTSPVQIDLGGIGKGYAIDQMARLLRDWSIEVALIHSGCSSVLALGAPQGTKGWPLTLSNPCGHKQILAYVNLRNRALSGSGLQKGRHIIDPRTARPVEGKLAAWACAHTAAMADALSTAFMVMSPDQVKQYCLQHSDTLAMVLVGEPCGKVQEDKVLRFGPWKDTGLIK
ncbi:MAG: FAD:protein FMN transferase [Planctomycetota bacterium]|jgi:thiamine biosynthesis lipoprotein